MEIPLYGYIFTFMASLLFVGVLTPRIREYAIQREIYDRPSSSHKTHSNPVPYLGGISIIIGVSFLSLFGTFLVSREQLGLILGVLLPSIFLGIVGLVDDLLGLEPLPRLIAQTIVGIVVATILIMTKTVGSPTGSSTVDALITVLFIVCLSNSINFFDNIDGGASGTVSIATGVLAILAIQSSQTYVAALSALICGSTLGFLWWNKSPARIYMGDAGSLFLGSLLAALLVRFEPNPITAGSSYFVPVFLVAIPLLDTFVVITSRIYRGISPLQGGRDHLSHRLMRKGFSKISAVLTLWSLAGIYGGLALTLSNVNYAQEREIILIGGFLWLALYLVFMKIPAADTRED